MGYKNNLYPHLLPESIELWEQYLTDHKHEYSLIEYDVRVGTGRDPGTHYSDTMRQMGIDLSQRRIDAVGHRTGEIDIIEIAPRAGIKAVGQMQIYPLLYMQTFHPIQKLNCVLVARELSGDIENFLNQLQIRPVLYPAVTA